MPAGVIMMSLQKVIVAHTASLPNTACARLVGIGAFSGTLRGFKLGSGKMAFSRPTHQRVTPAVGWHLADQQYEQ